MEELKVVFRLYKINEKPNCCWDFDVAEKNKEFLSRVDSNYFYFQTEVLEKELKGENKQRAALAIRNIYHHALETFMTLLCAGLQAPGCVYSWLFNSRTNDVREIVSKINSGKGKVFNHWHLEDVSWKSISDKIHYVLKSEVLLEKNLNSIADKFAEFWEHMGLNFLDDHSQKEYNAIKHGFRSSPGGYNLKIKTKSKTNSEIENDEYLSFGSIEFGSSFFVIEKMNSTNLKENNNYHSIKFNLDWNPILLISTIRLLSLSIQNLVNFLRIGNGEDSTSIQYYVPETDKLFNDSLSEIQNETVVKMDINIKMDGFKGFTNKEMNDMLDKVKFYKID